MEGKTQTARILNFEGRGVVVLIIRDIYPGSSTHPEVVFRDVLHWFLVYGGGEGTPGEKHLKEEKRANNKLTHLWPQVQE